MSDLVTISKTKYIEEISSLLLANPKDNIALEYPDGNPEFIALANLREYKNREGVKIYDDVYFRTRNGRSSGNNISFETYDYKTRQIRRKAEVLQYKQHTLTAAEEYKKRIGAKGTFSQAKLKMLRDAASIEACKTLKGSCSDIAYDLNVPFENEL